MRITPTWWLGLVIVVAYTAWLSGWSMFFHQDYRTIAAPEHVFHALVVPLAIATALLCVFLWRCGWARSVFFEPRKEHQPLFLTILLVLMAGCIALNVTAVHVGSRRAGNPRPARHPACRSPDSGDPPLAPAADRH